MHNFSVMNLSNKTQQNVNADHPGHALVLANPKLIGCNITIHTIDVGEFYVHNNFTFDNYIVRHLHS